MHAPAPVLWQVVHGFGGESGYGSLDRLWRARARVDRVVGGPGMRGRSRELRPGDALDFWRVEAVEPPRRLLLRAEMRMPGTARLELEVEAVDDRTARLVQGTRFDPAGLAGHAFWWAELAGHKLVFARLVDDLVRSAEDSAENWAENRPEASA